MKHPMAKRVVCVATALALLVALVLACAAYGLISQSASAKLQNQKKLESVSASVVDALQAYTRISAQYDATLIANAALSALPLRDVVREEGNDAIRAYENGCVVRLDGEDILLPEALALPPVAASQLRDGDGIQRRFGLFELNVDGSAGEDGTADFICAYQRIYGNYYYIDYTPGAERAEYLETHVNAEGMLRGMEKAYGGSILVYNAQDEGYPLIYAPEAFGESAARQLLQSMTEGAEAFETIKIDGEEYNYTLSEPAEVSLGAESIALRAAFIIPSDKLTAQQTPRLSVVLYVALLAFVTALVWVLSAVALMRRDTVTATQRAQYGVRRTRLAVAAIGVIGALAMLLATLFVDSLLQLYSATQNNEDMLDTLTAMIEQVGDNEARVQRQREQLYVSYAQRVADLLGAHPQLETRETLDEMCQTIGADYLMLYDDQGRELLSSAQYVNLSFGEEPENSTYDFRRLLTGVPSIVHEMCVDETTGLNRQLIGVCVDDGDTSDGYGALILALAPEASGSAAVSIDDMMRSLTTEDSLCLALDMETGEIRHASDPDLVGENALTLGMSQRALQDNYMDYLRLDGQHWYSSSNEHEGSLYHSATRDRAIFHHLPRNALVFTGLFLAAYALLAAVLLSGYTDKNLDRYGGRVVEDEEALLHAPPGDADDPENRLRTSLRDLHRLHRERTPEKKASLAFLLGLCAVLIHLLTALWSGSETQGVAYLIAYVLNGQWEPGVNLFAFAKIIMLVFSTALLMTALNLITGLLCRMLQKRGETICRLVSSLIQYVLILGVLFVAFNCLGFDTNALLTSVGVLSLTISLGAKDLVADVLSGVSIAFSDEYQIGDFVEINGFRGWVQEIGVRSTTLVNTDGNIKSMSNRDVKNVLNLSRRNCRYTIDFTIGYDQPLEKVEALLNRELPQIGKAIGEITEGPSYRGITAFSAAGMTLSITAECREQDYGRVRSRLNREVRLLLERNGIR